MELVYCDRCGFRVSAQELADGGAVRVDEKVFCAKCAPPPMPPLPHTPNVGNVVHSSHAAKKVGSRLISAIEVPKRPSASNTQSASASSAHDSKRNPSAGGTHPQKPAGNMALPIAAGVGACVLLIVLVALSGGGTKEKTAGVESSTDAGTRGQTSRSTSISTSTTATSTAQNHTPVYEQPLQTPSPMLTPPSKTDPETIASDAFDKLKSFDGIPAGDVDTRVKRLDEFIAKYSDTIAASRARRVRDDLKAAPPAEAPPAPAQPVPPTPATPAVTPPTPPPPAVKPGPNDVPLYVENFDGPVVEYLAFGEVTDGPPGSSGKVLLLKGKTDWSKAGLARWAKKPTSQKTIDFAIPENTRIRFRYFNANARDLRFVIGVKGEAKAYERVLDVAQKNTWINVDAAISECVQVDTGEKIKPGAVFDEIRFHSWGNGEITVYVDDLWIGLPGLAGAAPEKPGEHTVPASGAAKIPVAPGKIVGYDDFLFEFYAALHRNDRAMAAALLNAANFTGKETELAQDAKALEWQTELDALTLKGIEKLKDVDSFELKPEKGAAMNVGKKGKFHIDEIKDGVIYASSDATRVPVPVDSLDAETRDQLTLLAMDTDPKGALLRAFVAVKKLDAKAAAYQLAGARSLLDKSKSAGAPPEWASLKRALDLIVVKSEEVGKVEAAAARQELAAGHEWNVINQLFEQGKYDQIRPALDAFKEKYGATAFASKKTEEAKALQFKAVEVPLQKGLVGYWKFDEGKGSLTADASGNHNNGTVVGAQWVAGHVGSGVSFNGADDYVEVPDKPMLRITETLTVSLWFKNGPKVRNWARLVSKGWNKPEAPWTAYALMMDASDEGQQHIKFQASLNNEKLSEVLTQRVFPVDGTWHNIVGVFDGPKGRIAIYVDGVKENDIATANATIGSTSAPLRIGDDPTTKEKSKCTLDEVRIYNRALPETEVKALFGLYK